jgi:hypothetical protein
VSDDLAMDAGAVRENLRDRRAVLVVAHPGHELRIHGWLEQARPTVCVLTDGSGHSSCARLAPTTAILQRAGARPGPVYGRLTDRALYAAVLARDVARFAALAEELARVLVAEGADYVVGDALEGYHPAHDLCRVLIDAAVALAAARRRVASFDFRLTGFPPTSATPALTLTLDAAAFARKLAAARGYAELADEVALAVGGETAASFRVESLRPVGEGVRRGAPPQDPPCYERYGEMQVAAGRYAEVLRWRTHVAPLIDGVHERLGLGRA